MPWHTLFNIFGGCLFMGIFCAMVPFEHTSPADSLVSIIRKGAVTNGKDDTFIKEMNQGMSTVENFVNYPDNTGRTPLMWAAYCNFNNTQEALNKDISRLYYVRALLATPGLNAKAVDRDGFSALHWASWSGIPGLKDFNIFELIYAPTRESSYLGTVKAFDAAPAAVSIDDLKREMEAAENKAEAEAAKAAAEGE